MGGAVVSVVYAVSSWLVDAVHSAVPDLTVYRDDVPADPQFPYVFLQVGFPVAVGRSTARSVSHCEFDVRTTFVGLSVRSVEIVATKTADALEGCRVEVEGWVFGALESRPNSQPIRPDRDVTIEGIGHPQYAVMDWVAVGSENPA
jgi:hypothetical protein